MEGTAQSSNSNNEEKESISNNTPSIQVNGDQVEKKEVPKPTAPFVKGSWYFNAQCKGEEK